MTEVVGYEHREDIDKEQLSKMAAGHADWYADVQRNLGDYDEEMLKKIRFIYKDAFVHGFGHGVKKTAET